MRCSEDRRDVAGGRLLGLGSPTESERLSRPAGVTSKHLGLNVCFQAGETPEKIIEEHVKVLSS